MKSITGMEQSILLLTTAVLLLSKIDGLSIIQRPPSPHASVSIANPTTRLSLFFAEEAPKEDSKSQETSSASQVQEPPASSSPSSGSSAPVQLVSSDDERFLNMVGSFLVDAFWLNSDHHQLDTSKVTPDIKMNFVLEQCADLQDKFGETMGQRLCEGCVIGALDDETKELLGVATLKVSLLKNTEILESEKSEVIAKNAVASLGPKQRRLYKGASISTIATELLPADTSAVCVLSNLAVSKNARRRGVAQAICAEAENITKDWGYDQIHLIVEKANASARGLYEGRLGYKLMAEAENSPALRADLETGEFTEINVDTLVLAKTI